jgi:hypothetical protein
MKFISILFIFLVFAIVMVHTSPATPRAPEEKIGPNLKSIAVQRNGIYSKLLKKLNTINDEYETHFKSFEKELPIAAKKDNLPIPKSFPAWNDAYVEDVHKVKTIAKRLHKRIETAIAKAKYYHP